MIKVFIMDVDGTLTDGKIYLGNCGEEFKAFHVRDGYAITHILPKHEIIPVIITGRESQMVKARCEEMNISFLYQGVDKKESMLAKMLSDLQQSAGKEILLRDCAYIGDDMSDYKCMELIKKNHGIVGCPGDAVEAVLKLADYISANRGGEGCVRDLIEWIVRNEGE